MTPTEQDKELREQLDRLITENQGVDGSIDISDQEAMRDEILELITADRKRVSLEARINERNKIALDNYRGETFSESTNWQAKFEYFMDSNERRIAELKAQQEEV